MQPSTNPSNTVSEETTHHQGFLCRHAACEIDSRCKCKYPNPTPTSTATPLPPLHPNTPTLAVDRTCFYPIKKAFPLSPAVHDYHGCIHDDARDSCGDRATEAFLAQEAAVRVTWEGGGVGMWRGGGAGERGDKAAVHMV